MFQILVFLCVICASAYGSSLNNTAEEKVIGGVNADIIQFPYQLAVLLNGNQHCGASIISAKWALTAAHCVQSIDVYRFKIRAGSKWWNQGGSVHNVEMSIWHPLYNKNQWSDYDFAVLKVMTPFPLGSPGIAAIKLTNKEPEDGDMAVVAGWGTTRSLQLLKVNMPVVGNTKCRNIYGWNMISNRMLCAGILTGGHSTCFGDSGGALVSNGHQIGIVSWQKGCAMKGFPAVFSNVANQRGWIQEVTGI